MRSKTSNVKLILSLIITSILLFTLSISAFARDGTDGTELQITTPEQLEIQLGAAWAGVEFQLKTDAGLYPGTIPVGDDGVLRLEIGGSSGYQLTCLGSGTAAPTPEPTPTAEPTAEPTLTPEPALEVSSETEETPPQAKITVSEIDPVDPGYTLRDIPVWQMGLFGGGLAVAVVVLIVLAVLKKRRGSDPDEDDDDY